MTTGGEGSGVAVGERAAAVLEQAGGVDAHAPAAFDLLVVELSSARGGVDGRPHLLQRPNQVGRRGTRGCEHRERLVEVLPARGRNRIAVGSRDPDRGRATYRQPVDGLRDLGRRAADELDLLVREPALVEQHDSIAFQAQDPVGLQHARDCSLPRWRA